MNKRNSEGYAIVELINNFVLGRILRGHCQRSCRNGSCSQEVDESSSEISGWLNEDLFQMALFTYLTINL